MVDGAWAVALVGGVIGVGGSLGATVLNHWLQTRRANQLDTQRKLLLQNMLRKGQKWRHLDTLQRVIGADDATTIRLLLEIGARGSQGERVAWGLIAQNPLPENDQTD